ncbi:cyclic-di-AMP receptor [uncultured Clostridium sp.]|uniref:cyclic-di-AMP receptor n=1 Tax=uncultured Clostridium sp. TaxID=59620 RepID=UPI0025DD7234|nr:cyclic-di-AMP receptor [uncultured Clostridium sp.]
MKLVIAIVEDEDSIDLIDVLTEGEYRVTKLATTGGFLKSGNTTLMVGVEEEKVKGVIDIIKDVCKKRKEILAAPTTLNGGEGAYIQQYPIRVSVGGATVFVIDVDQFIKI